MDDNYENYNLSESEESLILEQIKYLHGEFVSIQQVFVGIISVALAVYAVVIYYAINSDKEEIFLILPFLFSLSIYNILKYTIKVLGLDAYIRHLEKLMNITHKKPLFLWQTYLVYANGYSAFGTFPQLPCFLAMGVYLGYRFHLAVSATTYPYYLIILLRILLWIQIVFLALMGIICPAQYWAVLDICETMPPILLSKVDIQEYIKMKPRQLYYVKRISRFFSKSIRRKKRSLSKKPKRDNDSSKSK